VSICRLFQLRNLRGKAPTNFGEQLTRKSFFSGVVSSSCADEGIAQYDFSL